MIDLIIPYYNNLEGLKRTLESIDQNIFYITIIDDNSDYPPRYPKAHQVFRYNQNRGPGYARQFGINKTFNPYIMFIDAGDIFISKEVQKSIENEINENPNINVFSWQYYYKDELTQHNDNRMHGRVYKRDFLNKYNISFCPESSYMDEDIGFNRTCNLITEIKNIDIPVIKWILEENSLTQKNNNVSIYRDQTRALSLVTIHAINICKNHNIDVTSEIKYIAVALYYWFIRTAAERPEYIQQAWNGAKIFYNQFKKEIIPAEISTGNAYLKKCLLYRKDIPFQINILRFTHDIQSYDEIPKLYRGEKNETL